MEGTMVILEALQWDMLYDAIQVVLCGVILCGMIWQRRNYIRRLTEGNPGHRLPSFSAEVLLQTVRQQTEQALETILGAVTAERAKLQPLLDTADLPSLPTERRINAADVPFRLGQEASSDGGSEEYGPYDGIRNLAEHGFSARQIAEQIKRPVGEVELALQLQRAVSGSDQAKIATGKSCPVGFG
jgi:hypothetical protein